MSYTPKTEEDRIRQLDEVASLIDSSSAFNRWWREQTKKGDPMRKLNIVELAFYAGWRAAQDQVNPPAQP